MYKMYFNKRDLKFINGTVEKNLITIYSIVPIPFIRISKDYPRESNVIVTI